MPAKDRGERARRDVRELGKKLPETENRLLAAAVPELRVSSAQRRDEVGHVELGAAAQQHIERRLADGSAVEDARVPHVPKMSPEPFESPARVRGAVGGQR
jgi:hypothetical protein